MSKDYRKKFIELKEPIGNKYITRCDYPECNAVGWILRCKIGHTISQGRYSKFFSDAKYGGNRKAKKAALLERSKWWSILTVAQKKINSVGWRLNGTYGKGIHKNVKKGFVSYVGTYSLNGVQHKKSFSVIKHGIRGAQKLAQQYRNTAIKKYKKH